jgi:hypothetical protein
VLAPNASITRVTFAFATYSSVGTHAVSPAIEASLRVDWRGVVKEESESGSAPNSLSENVLGSAPKRFDLDRATMKSPSMTIHRTYLTPALYTVLGKFKRISQVYCDFAAIRVKSGAIGPFNGTCGDHVAR